MGRVAGDKSVVRHGDSYPGKSIKPTRLTAIAKVLRLDLRALVRLDVAVGKPKVDGLQRAIVDMTRILLVVATPNVDVRKVHRWRCPIARITLIADERHQGGAAVAGFSRPTHVVGHAVGKLRLLVREHRRVVRSARAYHPEVVADDGLAVGVLKSEVNGEVSDGSQRMADAPVVLSDAICLGEFLGASRAKPKRHRQSVRAQDQRGVGADVPGVGPKARWNAE